MKNMDNQNKINPVFINELVLNEDTLREIALGIWTQKTGRISSLF